MTNESITYATRMRINWIPKTTALNLKEHLKDTENIAPERERKVESIKALKNKDLNKIYNFKRTKRSK